MFAGVTQLESVFVMSVSIGTGFLRGLYIHQCKPTMSGAALRRVAAAFLRRGGAAPTAPPPLRFPGARPSGPLVHRPAPPGLAPEAPPPLLLAAVC